MTVEPAAAITTDPAAEPALPAGAAGPAHDLAVLIRSQYPVVFLFTTEEERAEHLVITAAARCEHELFVWSITRGLVDANGTCRDPATKDVSAALNAIEHGRPRSVYVMLDFADHLKDETVRRLLRDFARLERQTIVIVGPAIDVPESLRPYSAVYNLPLPDIDAIRRRVRELTDQLVARGVLVDHLDDEQRCDLARALRGLTMEEVDRVFSRVSYEDGRLTVEDVAAAIDAKSQALARGGVLELSSTPHTMDEVAGFAGLKAWVKTRGVTFRDDARSMGLEPPKGVLLTGVPGCGKSFVVKAIARQWNMPLLRLDAGALFNKYIGETERNLRSALATAEALAPSMLWIDEIEKGFGTSGPSSSDGGLGYRIVGTLATWMQERAGSVFVAATSNDISVLPPELTRKGRFDEIFFVDLPDAAGRASVVRTQLARRGIAGSEIDAEAIAAISSGFSGAEIEQSVVSALCAALAEDEQFSTGHVVREIERTKPLSEVSPERVAALRAWGSQHARSADIV